MAFGWLKILSSKLVTILLIILYVHNLVAIANRRHPDLQGSINNDFQDESGDILQFESLSAALSGENDDLNVMSSLASSVPINFDPPSLNFSQQPIGMSVLRKIHVNNPTHSLTLQLISISGDKPDFHSSFFTSKVLRPGESTSFEIVFLPRRSGIVQDILSIQSSFGTYQYKISGEGVPNIFRLRPLRGARIPINATYSPSISMYNPFDSPLQIIEVYSSGGSLHLELPHGISEGHTTVWEIRPFETKQVAKASFMGEMISNHTGFVRIKTNHTSNPSILLPVEVEVSEASGLFLSRELLDFGMVKSEGQVKLPVFILNAGPHQVEIKSITPVPDNPSIRVEYTNTTIRPGNKYIKAAILIFSIGSTSTSSIDDSGVIKVWAEDKSSFHELKVPYEAHILQGMLDYEVNDTLFRTHDPPFSPTLRDISLINRFKSPIVIYSAKLSSKAQDLFTVENFNPPYVLQPDGKWHEPFRLRFHPHSSDCLFNTTLRLATNTSFFNIPLSCYDGSLEYDFGGSDVDSLEFGMMSERDSLSKVFTISNPNPVQISVTSLQVSETSNLPFVAVHLLSLPRQPKNEIMADGLRKGRRPPYYIKPGQQMVFSVNVTRPKRPGKYRGEILIFSSLGKVVTVPVNYLAVTGGLQVTPTHVKFSPTFPYSTSSASLHFKSTYTKPVKVLSLSVLSNGRGDSGSPLPPPVIVPSTLPTIAASTTTTVSDIVFNPMLYQVEVNRTYIMHDLPVTDGNKIEINNELKHFVSLWEMWQALPRNNKEAFEFAISIDTEIDKNITVTGSAPLKWPTLVDKSSTIQSFPVTLIGNKSELSFQVCNPTDQSLEVELFFLHDVSHPDAVMQALLETFHDSSELMNDLDNVTKQVQVYSIKEYDFKHSNDRVTSYKKIPKFILPPRGNQSLGMEFSPVSDHQTTELLLIRNNLTIFDFVEIRGSGSRGFITVDGIHPGGTTPLHLEFTQQMMMETCGSTNNNDGDCGCGSLTENSYTKVFIVRNSGTVPVMVTSTLGEQGQCHDHGFSVVNCGKQFAVYPNKTRKIDIKFLPDYTLSRITTTLRLTTPSAPPMEYPVLATLPHHMLLSCYSYQPRSEMESLASYLSVPLWILALLVMIIVTILQVNWHTRRYRLHPVVLSGKDVPVQSTGGVFFDLSSLAKKVTSNITEKVAELGKSVQIAQVSPSTASSNTTCNQEDGTYDLMLTPVFPADSVDHCTVDSDHKSFTNATADLSLVTVSPGSPMTQSTSSSLSSSPTRKSKFKKTLMKVEKTPNTCTSSSNSCPHLNNNETSEEDALVDASISVDTEASIQLLSRKESDDSIPDCDTEDRIAAQEIVQSQSLSFTKEPGTGQTILWKEDNDNYTVMEKPKQSSSSSSNGFMSYSVSVPSSSSKTRNKTKKQKAQQKREEKLKKKRKEKEECARKATEAQESFDKESTSSSTNSTDNLEDTVNEPSTPNDSEKGNGNQKTDQAPDELVESETTAKDAAAPLVIVNNEDSNTFDVEEDTEVHVQQSPSAAAITEGSLLDEEEEVITEMETSYSTIDFKNVSSASPSPDDLSNEKKLPPEENGTKEDVSIMRSFSNGSGDTNTQQSSPEIIKPSRSSTSLPSTPSGKGNTIQQTVSKPRPSKLDLHGVDGGSSMTEDGSHDKFKTRLDPHELAASLLKNMHRPTKQKQGSSGNNINSTTTVVKEKEQSEETRVVNQTKRSNRKKLSVEKASSDTTRDKRNIANNSFTPLSSDAMPFYPHYPAMLHPRATGMPHPPPPQPFPPTRGSVNMPLPYSHHHVSNPSYEYPMMRPMVMYPRESEQVHQFERKQRKRSEQKYPPKTFSPPTFPEGATYHDRSYPFPVHEYEPPDEWITSPDNNHAVPSPGYPEEDHFAQSYPTGTRRGGAGTYTHSNDPSYNYGPDFPRSVPVPPPPRSSTGLDESEWNSTQLTAEEIMYLKELRRQRMKKLMMEKHQQLGSGGPGSEIYEGTSSTRHSTDKYSLASLRERDYEPPHLPRPSDPYRLPSSMEMDSDSPDMMMSLRNRERKSSREDLLPYHRLPSASESINRAPGPPGSFPVSMGSSSLGQSSLFHTDTSDNWNKLNEPESSKNTLSSTAENDGHSAWHSLWTMQTPLLSALEEQRQQAAKANDSNSYDPFEGNIWSLKKDDDTFQWITKTEKN